MSFQPTTPTSGAVATEATGKRNPVLLGLGVLLLLAGVVAGLLLISKSSSSVGDNATTLARAPGGCTTSLEFDTTGEFEVYYESKGSVGDLGGDCGGNGASFDRGDDSAPAQTLTLLDPDDDPVALDDASGTTYDSAGFKGLQIATVTISDAGLYKLTVAPRDADDADYAIAIGKDPTADESTLKSAGYGALIAGVVIGAILVLLGLRKRGGGAPALVTAIPANNWNPGNAAPSWQTQEQPQTPPTWQPQGPPAAPQSWPPQPAQPASQPAASPPGFGSPPNVSPWTPAEPTEQLPPTNPFAPPRAPDA